MAAIALTRRRAWFLALRPFSYTTAIMPVLVGTALAASIDFDPLLFVLALAGSVLILAGTNLATDFFDFVDGVQPGASFGASIQSGLLTPKEVHIAAIATFAAGAACGLALVAVAGWPVLAAGVASVLAGYFYTASPIKYGRRGLGEVGVAFFMGPVIVMGAYFVQVEHLTWAAFYASVPVGILVANILHANNLRDIRNDRSRGKVTISTMVDRPVADYILWALVIGAFAVVAVCVATGSLTAWTLLVAGAIPAAASTLAMLREQDPMRLNLLVRNSARLHMHFGALLALGLVIEAL
ncbi:MAG TPA: 1,4-dihydroxy-2-naphthoate octaprenyltransferase [Dehalococcoidia bacterium]|nr:1,4-dihydroxy-2-naphthoate octaprenyltransferase [Dehalococcoidia bacterium]